MTGASGAGRWRALALAIPLAAAGCGAYVEYIPSVTTAARPPIDVRYVKLYFDSAPACPYEEVGQIEVTGSPTATEAFEGIRQQAAIHGADAAIIHEHRDSDHHGSLHSYTAIAVWLGQPCPQAVHAPGVK